MRILYGVAGEGMGHATRSRVVVDDLIEEHDLRLVASSDAHTYLAEHFPAANDVWDLTWHLHVMAHVYAARAVVPSMVARGEGYLLQTASSVAPASKSSATSSALRSASARKTCGVWTAHSRERSSVRSTAQHSRAHDMPMSQPASTSLG